MTRERLSIGLVVLLCGVGLVALLELARRFTATDEPEEAIPTLVSVHVGQLKRATLHGYVDGFGIVSPAPAAGGRPAASAHVAPAVAGVVTEVKVSEGEHVVAGAVLFQLNSQVADVAAAFATKNLERQRTLLQMKNTSERAVQDAEERLAAAQAQQALLRVTAPLSGVVTRVHVRPGEAVDPTTTLADIADLSRLVVDANIPSGQAGAVKVGQRVEVLAEPPSTGSVSLVSPAVDTSNDTVLVRIALPADTTLRPGQFLRVRVVTTEHKDCLAAPAESVVTDADGQSVIAVITGQQAVRVPVKTGLRDGGLVEVDAPNLEAGATVVTLGAYGLPDKTGVRILE